MLPKNLHYQNKVESASARSYTSAIAPINGTQTYNANSTILINIPTSPNTVLVPSESFLKFDIGGITTANDGTAVNYIRLDKAGAHGIIQRLRVLHGSQELENLDNYNALVGMMMSLQQSSDSTIGKLNILSGLSANMYGSTATREVTTNIVGERLNQSFSSVAANTTVAKRTYSISLMSMVGSLGSQYVPLFEMTSAPLTIQLQLVSSCLKFLCTARALASTDFAITNVEFIGSFIELSDESISIIRNSLMGSPLQYVIQSYANYQSNSTLGTSATSVTHPVPAKYASLRSLFCLMREKADGAVTFFPLGSNHYNIADWRLRVGSQVVPYKAPNSMVEHFSELIKAIGSLSDINHEPSLNWYNYSTNPTAVANAESATVLDATTKSDCFALGFDLETYASADKERIFAGMNTLNSDTFWTFNFGAQGANTGVRFDFYALFDNVLVFENGVCYSRK